MAMHIAHHGENALQFAVGGDLRAAAEQLLCAHIIVHEYLAALRRAGAR